MRGTTDLRHNLFANLTDIAPRGHAQAPNPLPVPPVQLSTLFTGTSGSDSFTGTGADDDFDMIQGGHDSVNGKGGNDDFFFGNTFETADSVRGGSGTFDILYLDGDAYADGLTIGSSMLRDVEQISLAAGNDYKLTAKDSLVAAGGQVFFNGYGLDAAHRLKFDGSAESDGAFMVSGSFGDDILIGGGGNDLMYSASFTVSGGKDTMIGNAGGDIFNFGSDFTSADRVEGGGGYDILIINGDTSAGVTFGTGVFGIEQFYFGDGFDHDVKVKDQNVGAGDVVAVVAAALTAGNTITFDGSAELDGAFEIGGGAGDDVLTGGQGADIFEGKGGRDTLMGEDGSDSFRYLDPAHSTGTGFDTIVKFDAAEDLFVVAGGISGVDATVNSGTLSQGSFNADLAAAIGAAEMAADHAVLYKPDAGNLAGEIFLVIDGNLTAGYQAGADWVVRLDNPDHLNQFGIGNF